MSYSLSVYVVELDRVRAAIGSRDDKLRRMIGGRFKAQLAHADDWFAEEIANGAPARYDAVRAVIDGGPFDEVYGFQYAYAYQTICQFYGRFLDNRYFSPFRGSWLEQVDEGLAELGIKAISLADFVYHALPAALPQPDELPGYGEWTPEQCAEALVQWESTAPKQREDVDHEVLAAIESCMEWIREAQARPGWGIAGFFL
ncbi:hypothetical protein [Nocardia sp. CS682]|uniref:DUF7691 family protein n=1 Tax=Nocardia sp. CS682 TaxID=1047172 RepID=UPI001074B44C|nr:hypothetical protein [Nocardia sp. CS682]QBS39918.1 hypothetical protein DMB37_06990 [Nocardia sp. CS682]